MHPSISPGRHGAARAQSNSAVTLVELVVVVAVIAAVAGMVSAHFPSLLQRATATASSAALVDIRLAVERHRLRTGRFPDGYDSLLQAPYTLYTAIPDASRRQLRPKDLDNPDRRILRDHGITTTWIHAAPTGQPVTWQPVSSAKALDVHATGFVSDDVAILDTTRIDPNALFGPGIRKGTPQESFLVVGLGARCSAVGAGAELAEAPVTPGSGHGLHPRRQYLRFCLVYRLDRADRRPLSLCGTIAFTDTGIVNATDLRQRWTSRR